MIQLSFRDRDGYVAGTMTMTDLRLTGGVIWNSVEHGLIAHYANGLWKHRGRDYPSVDVAGGACLLFGIARDPQTISEPIGFCSIRGEVLRANGTPIARYVEQSDMWQGLTKSFWWRALRIINTVNAADFVGDSNVIIRNPWEPALPELPAREPVATH